MLWSLEEGVIKFTIYGLLSFLLHTKFGTNNFIKFRQEAKNDQILTHDDKQNPIEIGHFDIVKKSKLLLVVDTCYQYSYETLNFCEEMYK